MNSAIQSELLRNYGLRENPFNVTPDPRFLFESRTHREALASLITGIECGTGFQALIAPPGMGKTTLLFNVLERFHDTARTAFLFQTQCNSREFLQYLLSELGVEAADRDLVKMHEALNQVLTEEGLAHRRVIVIIDEAQNLDNSVLETVRLLSDFETKREKLMQIIISGQPELAKKLASPELEQLHQRLQVITRLTPLTQDEITAYIEHRLKKSGHTGGQVFTPEALRLIARHSRGIPRKINTVCFNALLLAFARESNLIDAYMIDEVLADLEIRGENTEQEAAAMRSVRLASTLPLNRPAASQPQSGPRMSDAGGGAATAVLPRPEPPQTSRPSTNAAAGSSALPPAARPAALPPRATTPLPSFAARHRRTRSRGSWAGPVFAAIVCLGLLGAISFLYKRGNSSETVAAHSTSAQPAAKPSPAGDGTGGSATKSGGSPAPAVTDLTVPPENAGAAPVAAPEASSSRPADTQAQAAPAQAAAPDDTTARDTTAPSGSDLQARTRVNAPQRNGGTRPSRRAAGNADAQDNTPEVLTRNFNERPASGSAVPGASAAPVNAPAAQPSAQPIAPPPVAALPSGTSSPAALNTPPAAASAAPAANESGAASPAVPDNVTLPERTARARLIYKVAPEYPTGAAIAGSSVVLQAVVGKDGSVRDLHLVSGSSSLGEAAMEAASRWQFQPYKVNGQAVEFTTQLHVDFTGQ